MPSNKKNKLKTLKKKIMKLVSRILLPVLSKSTLANFSLEVKETLDLTHVASKNKKFSAIDLWHINHQKRSFAKRSFLRAY